MARFVKQREIGSYLFRLIKPQDFDQVVNITTNAFTKREPLVQGVGISEQEFNNFLYSFKDHFTLNEESVVAVEKKTGNVAATFLNDDYNCEINESMISGLSPKFFALIQYLDHVKEIIYKNNLLQSPQYQIGQKNQLFHLFLAATHQDHVNQGLLNELITLSEEVAQSRGYLATYVEASSSGSQYVFNKHNYKLLYEESYQKIKIGDFPIDMTKASYGFREGTKPGIKFMYKELNQSNKV